MVGIGKKILVGGCVFALLRPGTGGAVPAPGVLTIDGGALPCPPQAPTG